MNQGRIIVITGAPGTGKTTTASAVAKESDLEKSVHMHTDDFYRYYGVTWNFRKITTFLHRVQQFLFKAMNRRGCRRAYTWNGFVEMLKYYPLAKPKTYYCLY